MASNSTQTLHYVVHVSVTANGDHLPKVEVTINGKKRSWTLAKATNEWVYYLAVLSCIVDAVANGAHSAVVDIGDQTATRQLNGTDKPSKKHIRALNEAIRVAKQALPGGARVV